MSEFENVYEQSVLIGAIATQVERCFTDQQLMHQWLNPALACEPVGEWNPTEGGEFDFKLKIPVLAPTLRSVVAERSPGLIVWKFDGFFKGQDRWECQPHPVGTKLLNRFEFTIPNPLVSFGFQQFAASWTKKDMEEQLQRLKQVAERL